MIKIKQKKTVVAVSNKYIWWTYQNEMVIWYPIIYKESVKTFDLWV